MEDWKNAYLVLGGIRSGSWAKLVRIKGGSRIGSAARLTKQSYLTMMPSGSRAALPKSCWNAQSPATHVNKLNQKALQQTLFMILRKNLPRIPWKVYSRVYTRRSRNLRLDLLTLRKSFWRSFSQSTWLNLKCLSGFRLLRTICTILSACLPKICFSERH